MTEQLRQLVRYDRSSWLGTAGIVAVLGLLTACAQVVVEPQKTVPPVTAAAAMPSAPAATATPNTPAAAVATRSTPAVAAMSPLPAITKLTPPSGISCFMSDVTSRVDRSGTVFWNSQCRNNLGQLVFRTDATGTTLVFATGQGGRGSLDIGPDGRLYITVNDLEQIHAFRLPIPGWQP